MAFSNPKVDGVFSYEPVTKSDDDPLPSPAKWLLVGTAGTANLIDLGGTLRENVPLQEGYNPIGCKQVKLGGTAANIWALY